MAFRALSADGSDGGIGQDVRQAGEARRLDLPEKVGAPIAYLVHRGEEAVAPGVEQNPTHRRARGGCGGQGPAPAGNASAERAAAARLDTG